jgi:hypothetical protein
VVEDSRSTIERCLLGRVSRSVDKFGGVKMDERSRDTLTCRVCDTNRLEKISLLYLVGENSCSKVKREGIRQVAPAPAFFDCRDPRGRFLGLGPDTRHSVRRRGMYFYDAEPRRTCRQQEDAEPHSQAWERGGWGKWIFPFSFPRHPPSRPSHQHSTTQIKGDVDMRLSILHL